ncbi:MAG TPA: hypothetical protein PKA95_10920 [Thermomicrobiales bacterium]|nr:hypothetical protein [Thermomicrobiales bacterium]
MRSSQSSASSIASSADEVRPIRPPNGAGVQPSPMISVVTPCVIFDRQRGSRISGTIECDWISMNPGATTMPAASTTSAAEVGSIRPAGAIAATRSPASATSP